MTSKSVVGEWKNFVFKMVQPEDHPRVLQHLKDALYYPAFYRLGYTKEMDDEMTEVFAAILNDGYNLSFFAEDKSTGKVAGCRIITMEKRGPRPESPLRSRICRGILKFYYEMLDECNVLDRYKVDEYPHMFGISVDKEFTQQGLAIEIYRRAKNLMKERGFNVVLVAFISPYSRAAAQHHGFIQLSKRMLSEAKAEDGTVLYPEADPANFMDHGVFELN